MSNGQRFIGSAACQAQRDLPLCAQEPASLGTLQFEWELELEATDAPDGGGPGLLRSITAVQGREGDVTRRILWPPAPAPDGGADGPGPGPRRPEL